MKLSTNRNTYNNGSYLFIDILLTLVAYGKSVTERRQEQYDLGQKYLSELNYEQAL